MTTTRHTDLSTGTEPVDSGSEHRGEASDPDSSTESRTLAEATATLREVLDEVEAADDAAWAEYSHTVHDAIEQAQAELALALARLRTEQAESRQDLDATIEEIGVMLRQRIDTLRVRTHLGRMDVEEIASRTIDELERVAGELRQISQRIGHDTSGTLTELKDRTVSSLGQVVQVLRRAVAERAGSGSD